MSDIAERVSRIIRELPEAKAVEILDFAEFLKSRQQTSIDDSRITVSVHAGPLAEFRAHPVKVEAFTPLSREEANAR